MIWPWIVAACVVAWMVHREWSPKKSARTEAEAEAAAVSVDLSRRLPMDLLVEPTGQPAAPDFFGSVRWSGDPWQALPLLNAPTRQAFHLFVGQLGGRLSQGRLTWSPPGLSGEADERVATAEARGAAERLAQRLRPRRGPVADALCALATDDPAPRIRTQAIRLLRRRYPETPALSAAVSAGLADPDVSVRLAAALAGGPAHWATVQACAQDPAIPVEVRADAALKVMTRGGPWHPAYEEPLLACLRRTQDVLAVVAWLGDHGTGRSLSALDSLRSSNAESAATAIRARMVGVQGSLTLVDGGGAQGALSLETSGALSVEESAAPPELAD